MVCWSLGVSRWCTARPCLVVASSNLGIRLCLVLLGQVGLFQLNPKTPCGALTRTAGADVVVVVGGV